MVMMSCLDTFFSVFKALLTFAQRVEYAKNTRGIRVEYAWNTCGIRVETVRNKRRFKQSF